MTAIKTFSSSFDTANNFLHSLIFILIKFREKKRLRSLFSCEAGYERTAILSYLLLTSCCCCRFEVRKVSFHYVAEEQTRKYACAWLQLSSRTEEIGKIIFVYRSSSSLSLYMRLLWLFLCDMYLCLFYVYTIHRMYFSKTFAWKFDVWSECILRWMPNSTQTSFQYFSMNFSSAIVRMSICRW